MPPDDWLREDLRELKAAVKGFARDVQDLVVRAVGIEHRLQTAEEQLAAAVVEVGTIKDAAFAVAVREAVAAGSTTHVTTPGAAAPAPPAPPRVGVLEALGDSQVQLLKRPVIGPMVGLFYLAAATTILAALLGVPARQVRAWLPGGDVEETTPAERGGDDDAAEEGGVP